MFAKTPEEKLTKKFTSASKSPSERAEAVNVYLEYCVRWLASGKKFKKNSTWRQFDINLGRFSDVNNNDQLNVIPCTDPNYVPFYLTKYSEFGCQVMSPDLPDGWNPPLGPEVYTALRKRGVETPLVCLCEYEDFYDLVSNIHALENIEVLTVKMIDKWAEDLLANFDYSQLIQLCEKSEKKYSYKLKDECEHWESQLDLAFKGIYYRVKLAVIRCDKNQKAVRSWRPITF